MLMGCGRADGPPRRFERSGPLGRGAKGPIPALRQISVPAGGMQAGFLLPKIKARACGKARVANSKAGRALRGMPGYPLRAR
jgi:hypothetical protein